MREDIDRTHSHREPLSALGEPIVFDWTCALMHSHSIYSVSWQVGDIEWTEKFYSTQQYALEGDAENARHEIAGHENAAPCCRGALSCRLMHSCSAMDRHMQHAVFHTIAFLAISCLAFSTPAFLTVPYFHVSHFQSPPIERCLCLFLVSVWGRWKCETWNCGTWKCGTMLQGWKMRDMKMRETR